MKSVHVRLTALERAVLDALRGTCRRRGAVTASRVAAYTGQSPQGAALTLGSLARKRLVTRYPRGPLFGPTQAGWDMAAPRRDYAGWVALGLECGHSTEPLPPTAVKALTGGRFPLAWCVKCGEQKRVTPPT